MIKQIEYTNPYNQNKVIHNVECSDTETYANGNPIPVSPDEKWCPVFENLTPENNIYSIIP